MSRNLRNDYTPTPGDPGTTPTDAARTALDTIRKGWRHVLDPINVERGGTAGTTTRPATEDDRDDPPDARIDTPLTLAFWVHAALDKWPTIAQTLQPVDPANPDGDMHLVTTTTIDCTDVPAMADLLHREASRIATWVDKSGHDFGTTFVTDLEQLARAVARVAWPPKGDRITIGECPTCGRRIRLKAPAWLRRPVRVPQPTTDPNTYPEWAWMVPDDAVWEPNRDRPVTCRCGVEHTIEEWRDRIVDFEDRQPKTADELVVIIHERMGLRYQPLTIRTWQRRGLIKIADYAPTGHARYDVTQVLAALVDRERRRDRGAAGGRMTA